MKIQDSEPAAPPATRSAAVDIGEYREEFPIFESRIYLNSNSLGALSRRSLVARRRFEDEWNCGGATAWYSRWLPYLRELRAAYGRTIGAGPGTIALMPSVSAALAVVAGTLDPERRHRVVTTDLDFPTIGYQFLARRRLGIELVVVRSPDGIEVPLEAIAAAVDERTALVATSHVFFTTGAIQDVAALADIAHARGSHLLLDAYQSNGQIPIDAQECGIDFLVSGSLKWLLGGPGIAYLYVRPDLVERLEPTTLSWFGVQNPFDFDLAGAAPRSDARRFELGTPAMGAVYTATGGLEIIEEIGIPAIRSRNAALAEDLIDRLRAAGHAPRVAPEEVRRSALVPVPVSDPAAAVRRLARLDILIDWRPGLVRLSPHFYNSIEDNVAAVRALGSPGGRAC